MSGQRWQIWRCGWGDSRRQTSSNHAGIDEAVQIVEMRDLPPFMVAPPHETLLLETVGETTNAKTQPTETRDRKRGSASGKSSKKRPLAHEPKRTRPLGDEQPMARRARTAEPGKTVVFHSLPRGSERVQKVTSGELEPPCYGSVWPVVWGAGVRTSRLPDSASSFGPSLMRRIENRIRTMCHPHRAVANHPCEPKPSSANKIMIGVRISKANPVDAMAPTFSKRRPRDKYPRDGIEENRHNRFAMIITEMRLQPITRSTVAPG